MIDNIEAAFEKFDSEYLHFEKVKKRRNNRPDLCAFLILDELVSGSCDIVSAAEHDEIYLETDIEKLAAIATEDDIADLVRCGVRYDSETSGLAMFA